MIHTLTPGPGHSTILCKTTPEFEQFLERKYKTMQHPPQSVTIRYTRNLLCDGQNDEFAVGYIQCDKSIVAGHQVGIYFTVSVITKKDGALLEAAGATPVEALTRALEKHGVTFR